MGTDIITALCFILGLMVSAIIGSAIVLALIAHIGSRAAITSQQATLPEFIEWSGQ